MPLNPNYDNDYFNQSRNYFQQAAEAAMPSTQLRDTAASRIRSRLAGASQAQNQQLQDSFAARGLANSGAYQGAFARQSAAQQGALASGLADNEANYLAARQQGAGILGNLGQGLGSLGTQRQEADTNQAFSEGRLGVERGTLQESIDRRKNEQVLEALKTFGEYGNVSGQRNYAQFAQAIQALLGNSGVPFDTSGFAAPQPQQSGDSLRNPSGSGDAPRPQTNSNSSANAALASNGRTYSVGSIWDQGRPPAISSRSGFGWVQLPNGKYQLQRL